MAHVYVCDGCGEQIHEESFYFEVNFIARKYGGGGVLPGGKANVEWDHEDTYGDLCDECSEDIIETINDVLR